MWWRTTSVGLGLLGEWAIRSHFEDSTRLLSLFLSGPDHLFAFDFLQHELQVGFFPLPVSFPPLARCEAQGPRSRFEVRIVSSFSSPLASLYPLPYKYHPHSEPDSFPSYSSSLPQETTTTSPILHRPIRRSSSRSTSHHHPSSTRSTSRGFPQPDLEFDSSSEEGVEDRVRWRGRSRCGRVEEGMVLVARQGVARSEIR